MLFPNDLNGWNIEWLKNEEKRESLEDKRWSLPIVIFRLIYLKILSLLSIVEKYYNKPVEKNKEESERPDLYLSMSLLAYFYELCNGWQFEDMSAIDFFHALNLHQTSKPLEVCRYEKMRVFYLIHQLNEKIVKRRAESGSERCSGLQVLNKTPNLAPKTGCKIGC